MNPFYFRRLPEDAPFCDREEEFNKLISHAKNRANVVLFSPRRYGKTSLVRRVQKQLANEKFITIYIDFFGITSIEDVATRITSDVYRATHTIGTSLKKLAEHVFLLRPTASVDAITGSISYGVTMTKGSSGKELLENTMEGLTKIIGKSKQPFHIVIDEFQEITELKDGIYIEGRMRHFNQEQSNASHFFIGSRRRILADMFNNRSRPFYQSALNFKLPVLPEDKLIDFIIGQFKKGKKICSSNVAKMITDHTQRIPYYAQKLAYHIYEISGDRVGEKDFQNSFMNMLEDESVLYEAMLRGLGTRQIALLSAIAREPSKSLFSHDYISRHDLGSIGTVQGASKKLVRLDYIEQADGVWEIVDAVFAEWLIRR